jgi:TldD protein
MFEDIKENIKRTVSKYKNKVDYLDVRVVKSEGMLISFRQKAIEDVSLPRGFAVSVQALYKGGWGYATFNDLGKLQEAVKKSVQYAKKVGKDKSKLAKADKIIDCISASKEEKIFTTISLKEKIKLLRGYNNIIWKKGKKVVTSSLYYADSLTQKLFVSSEDAEVIQEKPHVYCIASVVSQSGGIIQRYLTQLASNNFGELKGKEKLMEKAVNISEKLTQAKPVKSHVGTVILDPVLCGVFAHEAFGHLSEADNVYENEQLAKVMKLGRRFGSESVTIIDDPTMTGFRGSYIYDDEGVRAKRTLLLKNGILTGMLHSRETAGKMGKKSNGHARAQGVSKPQVRMGVTYFAPGKSKFEEMLKNVKNGLYCIGWQGGNTDHEKFTFVAAYGIEIVDGKLGKMVRDVKLAGNLFETLKNIDMVGKKLIFEGGSCGKGGQYISNTTGGVHVRIQNAMVMGV